MNDPNRTNMDNLIGEEIENTRKMPAGSAEKLRQAEALQKLMDSFTKEEAGVENWYNEQENRRIDETDKKERRRIERTKNKRLADIEEKKSEMTRGKAIIESIKASSPIIAAIIGIIGTIICVNASRDELEDTFKFEETGRINSTGGRSHKRPNFWNKK